MQRLNKILRVFVLLNISPSVIDFDVILLLLDVPIDRFVIIKAIIPPCCCNHAPELVDALYAFVVWVVALKNVGYTFAFCGFAFAARCIALVIVTATGRRADF